MPDTSSQLTVHESNGSANTIVEPINSPTAKAGMRRTSVESFDLGGDLDLEKRLQGDAKQQGEGKAEGDAPVVSTGADTLAHDDPENPRSAWSNAKKWTINVTLCTWVLTLTYSSTAYIGSLAALEQRFGMSQEVTILGVTLTVLGFSAGPLLFGPSSELYGRQAVYRFCGLLYSIFSIAAAFAPNAPALLIFRFFIGFFGSVSINNVPASIGDFTMPINRAAFSVLYATMAFGGPALGPLCSSFIETTVGFRWNLRVMAIFNTVVSIAVAFVPESHGPTLLKWRIAKEGNAPPPLAFSKIIVVYKTALSRPIIYLFSEPTVTLVSIYLSVLYGILYGFFEAFGVVYLEIRGFSETSYGLTYIALGLGFVFGAFLLSTLGTRFYMHYVTLATKNGTRTQPEARLGLAYFGAFVSPISLFLFAWTAPFVSIHWVVPCIAEFLFSMSMLLIFTAFIPYLIDVYLTTAASALAAGMASRALVGSAFPLFSLQMYHALSVQGATSLLGGLAILLAPIPFVFNKYGPQMRVRSVHAVTQ